MSVSLQSRLRTAVTCEAKNFDKFVGYYQLNPVVFVHVCRNEDHYFVHLTGQGPVAEFPERDAKCFGGAIASVTADPSRCAWYSLTVRCGHYFPIQG